MNFDLVCLIGSKMRLKVVRYPLFGVKVFFFPFFAQLAKHYIQANKIRYAESWSRSQEK